MELYKLCKCFTLCVRLPGSRSASPTRFGSSLQDRYWSPSRADLIQARVDLALQRNRSLERLKLNRSLERIDRINRYRSYRVNRISDLLDILIN